MKKELMPLDNVNAVAIFQEGGLDDLLKKIHEEAESHVPDLTTDKGRKAIASLAAKVAKSKTYLDGLGKDMVSGWKEKAKIVDAERKKLRDDLDNLKVKIREPLTTYEQQEKDRVEFIKNKIIEMSDISNNISKNWINIDIETIKESFKTVREIHRDTDFMEQKEYANEVFDKASTKIIEAMDQREKYESEQAELNRLRMESEKREKADKEKAEAARLKKQREDADKAAVEKERQRVAAKEKAEKEAEEKRLADKEHREKINIGVMNDILSIAAIGISHDQTAKLVDAISDNQIRNLKITY